MSIISSKKKVSGDLGLELFHLWQHCKMLGRGAGVKPLAGSVALTSSYPNFDAERYSD